MWYIYIDESGNLKSDPSLKGSSRFFTLCLLVTSHRESFIKIGKAVKKTLKQKINRPQSPIIHELKGTATSLEIKRYFWDQIKECDFEIYSITLDKEQIPFFRHTEQKFEYDRISGELIDNIDFCETDVTRVQIVFDKRLKKREALEFNNYIIRRLREKFQPHIPLNIDHLSSLETPVLQAVDLFTWGIFRKYERGETLWYDIFRDKIASDENYP